LEGILSAIETSGVADNLRSSLVMYPIINALHILGISMLVGGVIAMDLRIVGFSPVAGRRENADLRAIAGVGFVLAVTTGALLFSVRASDYAQNSAMLLKLGPVDEVDSQIG